MGGGEAIRGFPDHHSLPVRQTLLHASPLILTEPCRAIRDVPLGGPVEPLTLDRRVHPEAFFKKGVEVEFSQRLWASLPFPGEVTAVRPCRLRLLDDEPLQDGEDLKRRLRHVLLSFGDNQALFLWLAMHGYGCAGGSLALFGFVQMEIARVDPSVATFMGVHGGLAMGSIYMDGSEEQKEKWLPQMACFEKIGCFGLAEPLVGSGASGGLLTTAKREGDSWILNGEKRWIGNAPWCDVSIIWARDVTDNQVKGFIVENKTTPGFSVEKIENKVALKVVQNGHITLKDVRVPNPTASRAATHSATQQKSSRASTSTFMRLPRAICSRSSRHQGIAALRGERSRLGRLQRRRRALGGVPRGGNRAELTTVVFENLSRVAAPEPKPVALGSPLQLAPPVLIEQEVAEPAPRPEPAPALDPVLRRAMEMGYVPLPRRVRPVD